MVSLSRRRELKLKGAIHGQRGGENFLDRTTPMAMEQESRKKFCRIFWG